MPKPENFRDVRGPGQSIGESTLAIHAGEREGRPKIADSLTTPLVQCSTFFFKDTAENIAYAEGRHESFEYGRYGNPTTRVCEKKIAALEGAEDALLSASGMNAATTMLLALVPQNGHVVTTTDCYRRTRQFVQTVLPKMGVKCTVLDPSDMAGLEAALETGNVSLFFSEGPTNPYLRLIDIPLVSRMCHAKGAKVCIDTTFATPVNVKPIGLGADLVLHSGTKYLAGHNDVLCGVIAGSSELVGEVRKLHGVLGGVIDPHTAWLVIRGLKTLSLRLERQNKTALALARLLEKHPKIDKVHYPGLESHPEYAIGQRDYKGFGGVVSFEVKGDLASTSRFVDALSLPYIAPSLGGVDSLVEMPVVMSYWDKPVEERARLGIKDTLVRFACGIEDEADVLADVEIALAAI